MKKIEKIIDVALYNFGTWLTKNDWRGKEHDCVNTFAHAFLMDLITPKGPLHHAAQICIECGIAQPEGYTNLHARRDLVVWSEPFHNTWGQDRKRVHTPIALMEWKTHHKDRLPSRLFYPHDEEWFTKYTSITPDVVGFVTAVYFLPSGPKVYWKKSHAGIFSDVQSSFL